MMLLTFGSESMEIERYSSDFDFYNEEEEDRRVRVVFPSSTDFSTIADTLSAYDDANGYAIEKDGEVLVDLADFKKKTLNQTVNEDSEGNASVHNRVTFIEE